MHLRIILFSSIKAPTITSFAGWVLEIRFDPNSVTNIVIFLYNINIVVLDHQVFVYFRFHTKDWLYTH